MRIQNPLRLCYPISINTTTSSKKISYHIYCPDLKRQLGRTYIDRHKVIQSAREDINCYFTMLRESNGTPPVPSKCKSDETIIAPNNKIAISYFINYLFKNEDPNKELLSNRNVCIKLEALKKLGVADFLCIKADDLAFISKLYSAQLDLSVLSIND